MSTVVPAPSGRLPDKRFDTFRWVVTACVLVVVLWSTLGKIGRAHV